MHERIRKDGCGRIGEDLASRELAVEGDPIPGGDTEHQRCKEGRQNGF
jgi:hypothetical protein